MIGIGANHWHCQDRRPWPMAGRLGQPSEPSIAGADLDPWPPFPQVTSDTSNMGKCTFLSIMDGLAPWREIWGVHNSSENRSQAKVIRWYCPLWNKIWCSLSEYPYSPTIHPFSYVICLNVRENGKNDQRGEVCSCPAGDIDEKNQPMMWICCLSLFSLTQNC